LCYIALSADLGKTLALILRLDKGAYMTYWHKRKLLEQKIKNLMLPKIASEDPWLNFKDQRSEQNPELTKAEDQGHPILNGQPHAIVSLENPKHPVSSGLSHDQQMKHLNTLGSSVEAIRGNYDGLENSFIIHNPKNIDQIKQFAHSLGQDSIISSSGHNHQMHFLHGPNAGMYASGQGHVATDQKPDNYYSEIPTSKGMRYVTYNFDFDKMTKDELPGGKGDNKKRSDFDPDEFEMGLDVEAEHTGDHDLASEIVADHLSEDPKYYTKLKSSGLADELAKGAMKRVAPFNPKKDVSEGHRKLLHTWVNESADRNLVPALTGPAKTRAMVKLYKDAISRHNPETNEREYLLFRGKTGYDHRNNDQLSGLTSFTPKPKIAEDFNVGFRSDVSPQAVINEYPPDHELTQAAKKVTKYNMDTHGKDIDNFSKAKEKHLGGVYSSWVPESAIHHIPNAVGQPQSEDKRKIGESEYHYEKEVIVNASHPNFKHTKLGSEHMGMVKEMYRDHLAKQPKFVKSEDIFKMFLHTSDWRPEPLDLEELEKVVRNLRNGKWEPEAHDPPGTPHPENPNHVSGRSVKPGKKPVWVYRKDIADDFDKTALGLHSNLKQQMPQHARTIDQMYSRMSKDGDRHVVDSGFGEPEARMRHFVWAMQNKPGYSLTPTQTGFQLKAERHAKGKSTVMHTWKWDENKFKFSGESPISSLSQGDNNGKPKNNFMVKPNARPKA